MCCFCLFVLQGLYHWTPTTLVFSFCVQSLLQCSIENLETRNLKLNSKHVSLGPWPYLKFQTRWKSILFRTNLVNTTNAPPESPTPRPNPLINPTPQPHLIITYIFYLLEYYIGIKFSEFWYLCDKKHHLSIVFKCELNVNLCKLTKVFNYWILINFF